MLPSIDKSESRNFSRSMMHRAVRSGGAPRLVLLPSYLPPRVGRGRGACGVRCRQSERENQEDMEAKIKIEKKEKISFVERDEMSTSFGTAYATRSEEEGFGGTYGGNQSFGQYDDEGAAQGNRCDYDRTQGSDVKEMEKGRHQKEKAP